MACEETTFGDFAELAWMREDDPLRDAVSSSSEQCLGAECLHWGDCFLNNLRQNALQAQIVIVNHHLFFADLMVKKGGFGEIIPRFQVAVFDEAHTWRRSPPPTSAGVSARINCWSLQPTLKGNWIICAEGTKEIQKRLEMIRSGSERLWGFSVTGRTGGGWRMKP
jgi:hypothetical protein